MLRNNPVNISYLAILHAAIYCANIRHDILLQMAKLYIAFK